MPWSQSDPQIYYIVNIQNAFLWKVRRLLDYTSSFPGYVYNIFAFLPLVLVWSINWGQTSEIVRRVH